MVHHAYIKWRGPTYAEGTVWRWILTADSADVIDEWWRVVSKQDKWSVERLAPDFFTYKKEAGRDGDSIQESAVELQPRLIFTLLANWDGRFWSPMVNDNRTDHVSGHSFYIRSKSNPEIYWYVDSEAGGSIYATKLGRTRFRFRIEGRDTKKQSIMISKDIVSISCASNSKLAIGLNKGELVAGGNSSTFTFGDLQWRFHGEGLIDKVKVRETDFGDGEQWELVT